MNDSDPNASPHKLEETIPSFLVTLVGWVLHVALFPQRTLQLAHRTSRR